MGVGKERFGHCISADSGNTVGEISGHASQINCVSVRQQRPLRAITGSDDTSLVFYHGAPFKFNTSLRGQHNKFVFGTAFNPDGSTFVSVGADRRICLFDGKTGEPKGQIGEGIHTGSIFGVSWSKDSKRLVTASADQTIRIWDAEAGKNTHTWRLGEEGKVSIPDQQVGVVWPSGRSDDLVISVDLDGNLNYLSPKSEAPVKIVRGHQKNVTAACISASTFFTGSYEGRVNAWDISTGLAEKVDGEGHSNYVAGMTESRKGQSLEIHSIGWDDTLRCVSASAKTFVGSKSSLGFQPKGITTLAADGIVLVASTNSINIYKDGQSVGSTNISYSPTAMASSGSIIAVGGDDKFVHVYSLSTNSLKESRDPVRRATGAISALSFSATSNPLLAAGTANGKVLVFDPAKDWAVVTDRWSAHTARVTSIAWDESGQYAASGSLDTNVYVWSLVDPGKRTKALNAHKDGVTGVAWASPETVLSAGGDATVKVWKVSAK